MRAHRTGRLAAASLLAFALSTSPAYAQEPAPSAVGSAAPPPVVAAPGASPATVADASAPPVALAAPASEVAAPGSPPAAPPEPAPDAPAARPPLTSYDRIGPFALEGEHGSFQPTFALQFIAWGEDREGELDGNADVRRLRFGFRASMLDGRIVARLQLNVWPNALELMDAYLDFALPRGVRLRVGQATIPFTRYRAGSFSTLPMPDWSLVTRYFGAERQLGIGASGAIGAGWTWDLGLYGGANRRAAHAVAITSIYGEKPLSASNLANPGPVGTYHPELVARVGHLSEDLGAVRLSDPEGGGLRHAVDLSVAGDAQPVTTRDYGVRVAAEALLKYEHLSWQGVWYQTWFHPTDGGLALGPYGLLAEASYRFDRHLEVAARYAQTWIPRVLRDDARQRADALIAAATTPAEAMELTAKYANVGLLGGQLEAGVGLNVYFIGDSLKWQSDLTWLRDERLVGEHLDDFRARTQLQLMF